MGTGTGTQYATSYVTRNGLGRKSQNDWVGTKYDF